MDLKKRGVWNARESRSYPCEMVTLGLSNLEEILALQELALDNLGGYTCLGVCREGYRAILGEKGFAIGVAAPDKLVAFSSLLFPGPDPDNLGRDLDIPEEELPAVCVLEVSFVHPHFRGNGLQRLVTTRIVESLAGNRRFRYLCATVDPGNISSLKSLFAVNMTITRIMHKYGGLLRYIMFRDFLNPVFLDMNKVVALSNGDTASQLKLIEKGYRGYDVSQREGQLLILYAKTMLSARGTPPG